MIHTQSDDSPDDEAVYPFLIDSPDDGGQHDFCKNLLYRHTDGTSRDSVPGGRGSAGGGASGGGGGQLEDGDLSNNEYYCSIRDASEDSPVRQHRMEEMRKQHYKENYVDFQHGKQLAQQTIQSTASKTPGLMESKNADGVGVVSSRQRDGSDEAGGAEETENTEDMLPPLRGGMEGEDNNGPLYCEPNSPSVVVGFKELRNKVEEDETGRLQRSAEVGEQKDPSSEFQSKRKAHYKTYVPFGSARRLASQTLEQEQQAGRGRENSLGEEVEGGRPPNPPVSAWTLAMN
ncbi:uncharacterized protein LOC134855056 [Symsagittifera roscoffensis]|uniref:uncharacterized protein LOC134855056 n=1 Tax=Symsagittifera roscoffensis TaxID=84072 RepID=UPI00307C0B66